VRSLRRGRRAPPFAEQVGKEREAKAVWRKVRVVTGLTLIGLGAIGIFLPIIPGVPLFIAGVALVGTNHPWVRPFMVRLRLWRRRRKRSG
jgi:hypothetical protein